MGERGFDSWLPGFLIKNDRISLSEHGESDQAKHDQHGEAGENVFFLSSEAEGHAFRVTGKWELLELPTRNIE